jgi:hypothetical protein
LAVVGYLNDMHPVLYPSFRQPVRIMRKVPCGPVVPRGYLKLSREVPERRWVVCFSVAVWTVHHKAFPADCRPSEDTISTDSPASSKYPDIPDSADPGYPDPRIRIIGRGCLAGGQIFFFGIPSGSLCSGVDRLADETTVPQSDTPSETPPAGSPGTLKGLTMPKSSDPAPASVPASVPPALQLVTNDADAVLGAILFLSMDGRSRRDSCDSAADAAAMLRNSRITIRRALTAADCGFPVPAFGRSVRTEAGIVVPARVACAMLVGENPRRVERFTSAV